METLTELDGELDRLQLSIGKLDRAVSDLGSARTATAAPSEEEPEGRPVEEDALPDPAQTAPVPVPAQVAAKPVHPLRRVAGLVAKAAALALYDQVRRSPKDWPGTPIGLARRFASRLGRGASKRTLSAAVTRLRDEPSASCQVSGGGTLSRVRQAVEGVAWGSGTLLLAHPAGAFGSALISLAWQPASRRSLGWGFRSGALSLAWTAGMNVVREFTSRRRTGPKPCPAP
ncbi:MAG: hypothetical protein HY822_06995 [Acidobacteria bacterium]|nr:hypothetical protein [Acidobacteriota bacterium]